MGPAIETIRANRERLPWYLRHLHRLQTAVPDAGQDPKDSTPLRVFGQDLGSLAVYIAVASSGAVLACQHILLAPVGIAVALLGSLGAIGRLRRLVVGHMHETMHGVATEFYVAHGMARTKAERISASIANVASALTFTLDAKAYRASHNEVHHDERYLGTEKDPEGRLLKKTWGIWPDRTDNIGRALLLRAINPVWHARYFWQRIKANLVRATGARRILGAASLGVMVGSAFVLPLPVWLAAVALPWGPGYQIASMMQVITEHRYGYPGSARTLEEHAERNWTRIPYTAMPAGTIIQEPKAWAEWSWRMLGHTVERLTVLDDTMIGHAWHHLAWPLDRPFYDWWNTMHLYVAAKEDGILPAGDDERIVEGVRGALELQQQHFDKMRQNYWG